MNARNGALAFVIGVRILVFAVAVTVSVVVSTPVRVLQRWTPEPTGYTLPWVQTVKDRVKAAVLGRLPSWVTYRGKGLFTVETTRGMKQLDRLVDRVPQTVFDWWQRFGTRLMMAFLFVWALILLAAVSLWVWATGHLAFELAVWALEYDWLSLFEVQRQQPEFDPLAAIAAAVQAIPEIALALAILGVIVLVLVIAMWVAMLPLLPGLALHELGHYAAIRRSGAIVESYGLLLFGPVLAGAFVEPGSDANRLDVRDSAGVWAAGIANSVLWGALLVAFGVAAGGQPLMTIEALVTGGATAVVADQPVGALFVLLGSVEFANAFGNAYPGGRVDGGGFIRRMEREWWGFDAALAECNYYG